MPDFAASYVDYLKGRTNAPEWFHAFAALSLCGAALEDRVWIEMDWGRVYPSLWTLFVGPSKTRKSTAINIPVRLIKDAKDDVAIPSLFSFEALVEHLAKRPYGLLDWGEIAQAFGMLGKEYNSGSIGLLISIWDHNSVQRLTKSAGLVTINSPALSIMAGGKSVWFQREFQPKSIGGLTGGFLGRWLVCMEAENTGYRSSFHARRNGSLDGLRIQRQSLVEHLQTLFAFGGCEVEPTDEALDVFDAWASKELTRWTDEDDPSEFSHRAEANVMKLAIAIQAAWGTSYLPTLHPGAVKRAIEMWIHSFTSGRALVEMMGAHTLRDTEELEPVVAVLRKERQVSRTVLLVK